MKKTAVLILCCAATIAASCIREEVDGFGRKISKIVITNFIGERETEDAEIVFHRRKQEEYSPTFDARGRISKLHKVIWIEEVERPESGPVTRHFVKSEDIILTFSYNEGKCNGTLSRQGTRYSYDFSNSNPESSEKVDESSTMTFNSDWCMTSLGGDNWEYEGERLKTGAIWEDGKLVSYGEYRYSYSGLENPFAESFDLSLGGSLTSDLPEYYTYGLMGKRSSHIPSRIDRVTGGQTVSDFVTVTRDAEEKITKIRLDRKGDPLWYSIIDFSYTNNYFK